MPSQSQPGLRDAVSRNLGLIFPILIVGAVLVMVAPLPPLLLDLLLAANITLSVVVLLTTIHVASPREFSVFPALLLGTTLTRLVLNVASTRLILTRAADGGTEAAGRVIAAFGDFVAGGSPAVGLVIFLILVTIQFLVVTKGATRIGEVAARFALDGMPGRQMAVDADLANGLITKDEAGRRRNEIAQQADFYGAMDGASKFVRGDAVAGLVITCINIIGGLAIGVISHGMSAPQAASVFTTLTIGDGLVAQIPALLVSIAAGLLVTRTSVDSDLPRDVVSQVFRHPVALYIAAAFLFSIAFTGLPTVPLLALGGACLLIGRMLQTTEVAPAAEENPAPESHPAPPQAAQQPVQQLRVESLELELGLGLIRLADASAGGDLLDHISRLRTCIAAELGFIVPKVRVRDNLRLDPRQFQIKLRGVPVAWNEAYAGALFAVDEGDVEEPLSGISAEEPGTGNPAIWIEAHQKDAARSAGYHIHDPHVFLVKRLSEVVRVHAGELLTRQQVFELLEQTRQRAPHLVDELVPNLLKTSHVHQVLSNLLTEQIPIRDLETILEALGNAADQTRNPILLTETARRALARTISQTCCDRNRTIHAIAVSSDVERLLSAQSRLTESGLDIAIDDSLAEELNTSLGGLIDRMLSFRRTPVLVCSPGIRAALRALTRRQHPSLFVVSRDEVTPETELVLHGKLALATASENETKHSVGDPAVAIA